MGLVKDGYLLVSGRNSRLKVFIGNFDIGYRELQVELVVDLTRFGVAYLDRLGNHSLHQLLKHLEPYFGLEVGGAHVLAAQSRLVNGEVEAAVDLEGRLRFDHSLQSPIAYP